tara:strand:+ start:223 stop:585 length:363 start_codon:yes stop_codon:yes gene_type:complete
MDRIVKKVTLKLIDEGINATKYIIPQSTDISASNYSAVIVNVMDENGFGTKDTSGANNQIHTVRVDIFCRLASEKDGLFADVTSAINAIPDLHTRYEGKVNFYDEVDDIYQQTLEYIVKE